MIGDNIRQLREAKGLGQSEFAELLGIKRQTLFKYEKNIVTNIPLSRIERMATLLGVEPGALTGWSDKRQARLQMYYDALLEKIKKLDEIDRARIGERVDIMLEDAKYHVDRKE